MAEPKENLGDTWVAELDLWRDGPPHELFKEMRAQCPVHWSAGMTEDPDEPGYWSVTRAEDVKTVSRDWRTYSSHPAVVIATHGFPVELEQKEFIAMDPPRHDRIKALFQAGFTPKRIALQEPRLRAIIEKVFSGLDGHETCDLVKDVAAPVVSRVTGEFVGIPEEEDPEWAALINARMGFEDEDVNQGRTPGEIIDELFARCQKLIAERRVEPRDDLASILVHAEVEGEELPEDEVVMGIALLLEGGLDSTKATFCSGMRELLEHPAERRKLLDDPSLIPSAVEESLRMFPPFAHMRRTATCDAELGGQQIKKGDKVIMWYPSSNRDEAVYEEPDRFDAERNPDHQSFGAGGRHFCLGFALARLELNVLFEETLRRYPEMELDGEPVMVQTTSLVQLKSLPVRLGPRGA